MVSQNPFDNFQDIPEHYPNGLTAQTTLCSFFDILQRSLSADLFSTGKKSHFYISAKDAY
jgi:hypothetical protein